MIYINAFISGFEMGHWISTMEGKSVFQSIKNGFISGITLVKYEFRNKEGQGINDE